MAWVVWRYLGNVERYIEPFCGSAAVLLARPVWHEWWRKSEIINDADGYVVNAWRAIKYAPDEVVHYADWIVSEVDLAARNNWLIKRYDDLLVRLASDPDYYDPKIAGWWIWGATIWLASGWCAKERVIADYGKNGVAIKMPNVLTRTGINRCIPVSRGGVSEDRHRFIREMLHALSDRLREVRVVSGDWRRVLGDWIFQCVGPVGVFLDPPYRTDECKKGLYKVENNIWDDVVEWAIANGNNPRLRIALCGYDGFMMPEGWRAYYWVRDVGYSTLARRETMAQLNRKRETIWFSPHCLAPWHDCAPSRRWSQMEMFDVQQLPA